MACGDANLLLLQFEAKLPARKFQKYVCVGPLAVENLSPTTTEKDDSVDGKVR